MASLRPESAPSGRSGPGKALDSWVGTTEAAVVASIEQGYIDSLRRAAELIEEKRQRELAALFRDFDRGASEA